MKAVSSIEHVESLLVHRLLLLLGLLKGDGVVVVQIEVLQDLVLLGKGQDLVQAGLRQ